MQQYSGEIFRLLHGKIKNHSVSSVPILILLSVSCFQCAEIIKNMMDENYGGAGYWNVIVGESFDVGSYNFKPFKTEISRSTVPMTREAKC